MSEGTRVGPAGAGVRARGSDPVLDALVWHALTTVHARFAQGTGPARRYDPDVAGFVALDPEAADPWDALAELVGPGEPVLLSGDGIAPPPGWERLGGGNGHQMVRTDPVAPPASGADIVALTATDVPQMLALVELTQPGPFRPRTIELGHYYGVFDGDRLVAMAGERLQTPACTEVSAVCTHPDVRGRGLAAALTHHVAAGIAARGQTPLLHVAKGNDGARRVYERLGFTVRRELEFAAVRVPP